MAMLISKQKILDDLDKYISEYENFKLIKSLSAGVAVRSFEKIKNDITDGKYDVLFISSVNHKD